MSDASTANDPTSEPARPGRSATDSGLRITIVWHRDPRRIGATAWAAWGRRGLLVDLGRHTPGFDDGEPLGDHRISRSPLQLVAAGAEVELWPTGDGQRFDVDGHPGRGGLRLTAEALARGVRLGLGKGALVDVRRGPPPRAGSQGALVGRSEATEALTETIGSFAASDRHVLICGESGTGKELVAQALHARGPRGGGSFVAVNAAALTPSLAASQLFGHVRGAFTGADAATSGMFGRAHRGTLFLDEIGACPIDVQALLLRALESGETQVVGGSVAHVDVRAIAATDADLPAACQAGTFRAPLYHRLAQRVIRLAPLRERPVDIAVQAAHFLREGLQARGRDWPSRASEAAPWLGRAYVETLLAWTWPGNTRELRALIDRTLDRDIDAPACGPPQLATAVPARRGEPPVAVAAGEPDVAAIVAALTACDHRLTVAADRLGMSLNTLKKRMEAAHLRRPIDIDGDELQAALARAGSVAGAARDLQVSEHGLRIRMTQLGLVR